jgi:hypothetical protein
LSADDFVLTLWTNDVALARQADGADIQRIGVDLETFGKAERQRGLGTWISPHTEGDLSAIGAAVTRAELFVRVNPLNPDTPREVEAVLARGARTVMLPMVTCLTEAAEFATIVSGRAHIVLLIERREAVERLADLVQVAGVDEVHIGLNDLALSMGLANRWLVLAGDTVAKAAGCVRAAGLRFGFGGLGRAGDDSLPIPSDLVYAEYARTGATAALVSRSFHGSAAMALGAEVCRARQRLAYWRSRPAADLTAAHDELGRRAVRLTGW